ncbi:DODA-type extradiol aromatic ring-opening family dioxygenase [Nocardioides pyridinolyticus]
MCLSHSPFMTLPDAQDVGLGYRGAVDQVRAFIDDFAADVVVLFAPDHMNLLNEVRPPFTGVLSGRTLPEFGIPEIPLTVHPIATELYRAMVQTDVDLAVAENVSVDHGMGLTLTQLFDEPSVVPLVPIIVNAIGFPLFPVARAARVGAILGRALSGASERILFVGTGGLSHHPPFPEPKPGAVRLTDEERAASLATALDYVDPEWDQALLAGMARGERDVFSRIVQDEIDPRGGGANEIRTWAAAWAAAGSCTPTFTSYELVEKWITGMGVSFGLGARVEAP